VVLGFDNDAAGRKMTETISLSLKEMNIQYEVVVPQHGKDWNDELRWVNNPSMQRDEEMELRMEKRRKALADE
jgi:DNA primase